MEMRLDQFKKKVGLRILSNAEVVELLEQDNAKAAYEMLSKKNRRDAMLFLWMLANVDINQLYNVTDKFPSGVFAGMPMPSKIETPEGFREIRQYAFDHNDSIEEVQMSDSVKYVGEGAFQYCKNLKSIKFSNGLTTIGYNCLEGCESLTKISLPNALEFIPASAFAENHSLQNIIIPGGVERIETWAFLNCTSLTQIKLPKSVTRVEMNAFTGCTNVKIKAPAHLNTSWKMGNGETIGVYESWGVSEDQVEWY